MDFIAGLIIAVKSLVFMGGYISPDAQPVRISGMTVHVVNRAVSVSCSVSNAFTPELKKLAASGTPILLYMFADLKQQGSDSVIAATAVESRCDYDLATRMFRIIHSVQNDTVYFVNVDSALADAARFKKIPVSPAQNLSRDKAYYFVLYSVLGKTRVEALQNNTIDLMYFWNYKRPSLKTESFAGSQFMTEAGK